MNWNMRCVGLILAMLFLRTPAMAQTAPNYTTWSFSGIVRHYEDAYASVRVAAPPPTLAAANVLPGTLLTGHITLDLDAPDGAPEGSRGQFSPVVGAKMNVGNLNMNFNPSAGINLTVINNHASVDDLFTSAFSMRSSQFNEIILGYLELNDRTKKAFTSARLPTELPPLSAFDAYDPNAAFPTHVGFAVNSGGIWLVHAELVQLKQNPEPSTLALLALATAGALSVFRRRNG